jgi:hypothetical protein
MRGGKIRIDRRMIWLALAIVPFLVFVGIMAVRQGSTIIGAVVAIGAVVCGLGCLPGLSSRLDLTWDVTGISGCSQWWGPFIGLRRDHIAWDDIMAIGSTPAGYAYVATADGRCVLWTEMHRGHDRLFAALQRRRPDLLARALAPAALRE